MVSPSQQVNKYIAEAPEFARPILEKVRTAFHKGCPDVEEVIKWGVPHFTYHGLLGGMAAFKHHVSFGFWKSKLMSDSAQLFGNRAKASMCNAHFKSLKDLPTQRVLVQYVREAVKLNEEGASAPKRGKPKADLQVPPDLTAALNKNKKAKAVFDGFTPGYRRDYIEWLDEARRQATRQKRLTTAIEWLAEGKPRNWKYMR